MVEALENCGSSISAADIKTWKDRDPILSRIRDEWPKGTGGLLRRNDGSFVRIFLGN